MISLYFVKVYRIYDNIKKAFLEKLIFEKNMYNCFVDSLQKFFVIVYMYIYNANPYIFSLYFYKIEWVYCLIYIYSEYFKEYILNIMCLITIW